MELEEPIRASETWDTNAVYPFPSHYNVRRPKDIEMFDVRLVLS